MADSVQMPALGESVTEGTVTRWLKQVGDRVEVDEPLLEVSTDKVDTEIPSPLAGVLEEILVGEDETVEVGTDLARIGSGEGGGSSQSAEQDQSSDQSADSAQSDESDGAGDDAGQDSTPSDTQASGEGDTQSSGESGGGGGGTTVQMPALGESVTEGTVTRWLKQVGEDVEVDEPLLEVSTDKVDTEVPSPVAGKVTKILVGEDETVEVGADLVIIGGDGPDAGSDSPQQSQSEQQSEPQQSEPQQTEQKSEPQQSAPQQSEQKSEPAQQQEAPKQTASASAPTAAPRASSDDSGAYVTPLVRRMAADRGVDLGSVTGTGVGGRIRKQDVIDAAEQQKAKSAAPAASASAPAASSASSSAASRKSSAQPSELRGQTVKMTRLRKVIAQRMVESLQVAAQLTTVVEVDVTKIARLRDQAKNDFASREGVKLSFMPFFALAAVEALKQFPMLNASVTGDEITYHDQENLGVAVDTERGLLVPVIHGAGDLNIAGIARKIADLAARTRDNKVTPDELGGGTFTLTNTGSRGALFDTPIINQPQTGILGTGSVVRRPMVVKDADGGETIAIRSMIYLALSYDHRIVDGADAARFLTALKERLEEGAFEADLGL